MKALMAAVTLALVTMMVASAHAQAPATPSAPHQHEGTATPAPPAGGTMPMEMCRQMMAGPMMGMSGAQGMDPKMKSQMMEMHGEMMKAMGEVMMKHARRMGPPSGRP